MSPFSIAMLVYGSVFPNNLLLRSYSICFGRGVAPMNIASTLGTSESQPSFFGKSHNDPETWDAL